MNIEQREIIITIAIVSLQGRLDAQASTALKQLWEDYSARGISSAMVNMSRVSFVDSVGVSTLVSGMKQMRAKGGDLKLIGLQPAPRSLFELMMLDKVFTIFETEEEALRGY